MGITLDTLNAAHHSVAISDGQDTLAITAAGAITVDSITNAVTVSATQLDIDDLSSASDNVEIRTAAGQALAIDGSGFITANAVQSGTWNIATLTSITNDVNIADGGNVISVDDGGGSITVDGTVSTVAGGYASWLVTAASVGATESELVSTPLAGRLRLIIQNLSSGSDDCYLRQATGVTSANGLHLPRGASFEAELDDGADVWAISGGGTALLRIAEFAA